jgi:hypothetical protein
MTSFLTEERVIGRLDCRLNMFMRQQGFLEGLSLWCFRRLSIFRLYVERRCAHTVSGRFFFLQTYLLFRSFDVLS